MEINNDYQDLVDKMALGEFGYIEIQGIEGRDPEKRLEIHAYRSKESQDKSAYYFLPESRRKCMKQFAARHSIEFEELPDQETKSKVQQEFEVWINELKAKEMDKFTRYDTAVQIAKELSVGVVRGYWRNEIAGYFDIIDLKANARMPQSEFYVGRSRLATYMRDRIGYGRGEGQTYITKRGVQHYHGYNEVSAMDSVIGTLVGIGMLKKTDVGNTYELTREAFDLLKKRKWHERHAELLSWVSVVSGILSIVAVILSIYLMLKQLGLV